MTQLDTLLHSTPLPPLVHVRQRFTDDAIANPGEAVLQALETSDLAARLPAGGDVAIGVGSRGLARLAEMVQAVVHWFCAHGAKPFIFPAMGSHGGGTAEGQRDVLAHLGITEARVGCPIRCTMDVQAVDRLENGMSVYLDALAARAGAIFMINRIKPHTGFTGAHESGLVKMAIIGLGKQRGAEACHQFGYGLMADNLTRGCQSLLAHCPQILGGLAVVENAYDKPCHIEFVPRETLIERDAALLCLARERLGKLPVAQLDALLLQWMGKEISGAGMDPNVVGRAVSPFKQGELDCTKIGVLRLTPGSGGNACGVSIADVIPQSLHAAIDMNVTYLNVLTSTMLRAAHLPVVLSSEESVARCLVRTCNPRHGAVRLMYLRDTANLEDFWVSKAVAEELATHPRCQVDTEEHAFVFDAQGVCVFPDWERGY